MQIVYLSLIQMADPVSISDSFLGPKLHLMKSGCIHYEPIFPLSFITEIIKINHLESSTLSALKAGGRGGGRKQWNLKKKKLETFLCTWDNA